MDALEALGELARDHELALRIQRGGERRPALPRCDAAPRRTRARRPSPTASRGALRRAPASPVESRRTATAARRPPTPTTLPSPRSDPGPERRRSPASPTARTSAAPGSLIAGVPASVTSATRLPCSSNPTTCCARRRSLCSLRLQYVGADAVVREQYPGHARVLRRDDIDLRQNVERAQGDVAQIPDRRGDHI